MTSRAVAAPSKARDAERITGHPTRCAARPLAVERDDACSRKGLNAAISGGIETEWENRPPLRCPMGRQPVNQLETANGERCN